MRQAGFIQLAPLMALNWSRILVYAAVVTAIVVVVWFHGFFTGRAALHDYKAEQALEGAKIIVLQGKATERVVTEYVKVAGETRTKIEYRDKEVIRYVDANLDQCPLTTAWVSLHDSAAANTVPDPARSTDGTPSGTTAAQAVPAIQANYSTCHQTADRLRGLQAWVRAQQAATR